MTTLCAECKRVMSVRTDLPAGVSHSICHVCMVKLYPDLYKVCPSCEGKGTDLNAYGKRETCPDCEGRKIVRIDAKGKRMLEGEEEIEKCDVCGFNVGHSAECPKRVPA